MNWKKTLLICFIILLAGVAVVMLIFSTEPTATRSGATQQTAMLVDIQQVERNTYHPTIEAMGTVRPSQDIILSPRVSGEVVSRSENFTPGGYVEEGEVLLTIDPSDYENTLQQRKSDLQQAVTNLKIEMGQQNVAEQDYQMLDDSLSKEHRALVLREPQLDAAKSEVQSARAAVRQAELELERTTIEAPFNAHILSRNVNIGSQVAPGDELGRLVGLDIYWVEATVPLSKLRRLEFPGEQQVKGSEVRIRNRTAWDSGEYRTGYLYKLVGALEDQTRMARVLIAVPDPQAYRPENNGLPPLIIGAFVETHIQAEELSDVIRLSRDYIRQNDTVWIMENGELHINDVDILFQDAQYAYIDNGLTEQDSVVTSNLTTITEGAPLRIEDTDNTSDQETVIDNE